MTENPPAIASLIGSLDRIEAQQVAEDEWVVWTTTAVRIPNDSVQDVIDMLTHRINGPAALRILDPNPQREDSR